MRYLVEVEDKIEFTDVSEILIEDFNKRLHHFEDDEFVLVLVDDGDEVETGESLVDYFKLFVVQEIAHLGVASDDELIDLSGESGTSLSTRCFSVWERLLEYHLVRRDLPWRLIRKKQ